MAKIPRLFLDASMVIAAAASKDGGSSLVLELCINNKAKAVVTRLVLSEAERNIREKLGEDALIRYFSLLAEVGPELVPLPSDESLEKAREIVADKDAHILAGARVGKCTHLVTLDRKHLLLEEVVKTALPIIVCTPGDYLRDLL